MNVDSCFSAAFFALWPNQAKPWTPTWGESWGRGQGERWRCVLWWGTVYWLKLYSYVLTTLTVRVQMEQFSPQAQLSPTMFSRSGGDSPHLPVASEQESIFSSSRVFYDCWAMARLPVQLFLRASYSCRPEKQQVGIPIRTCTGIDYIEKNQFFEKEILL